MPISLRSIPHLVFKPHPIIKQGVQAVYKDWSIILTPGSYGYENNLYEVMGPGFNDGDVEGHLTLGEILIRISEQENT